MPNSWSYPWTAVCHPLYWAGDNTLGEKLQQGQRQWMNQKRYSWRESFHPVDEATQTFFMFSCVNQLPAWLQKQCIRDSSGLYGQHNSPKLLLFNSLSQAPRKSDKGLNHVKKSQEHTAGGGRRSVTTIWEVLSAMQPTLQVLTRALIHTRSNTLKLLEHAKLHFHMQHSIFWKSHAKDLESSLLLRNKL